MHKEHKKEKKIEKHFFKEKNAASMQANKSACAWSI